MLTPKRNISRRTALAILLAAIGVLARAGAAAAAAGADAPDVAAPGGGPTRWAPADDAVQVDVVRVFLASQDAIVETRRGVVAYAPVTTGRPGAPTPVGAFAITGRDRDHVSTRYPGAAMPFALHIGADGIALHGGELAATPSSGGCVRLPMDLAAWLFDRVSSATIVEIRSGALGDYLALRPDLAATAEGLR